jgi:hypothetical protein
LTTIAQDIPNGDLEEWQTVGGWFENPTYWSSLNNQVLVHAEKDTSACQKNLALKVKPLLGIETSIGLAETSFPFTYVPSNIGFCVKTNIDSDAFFTDTCRVKISFWNEDIMVYEETWTNTESISEWTNVVLPLNQIEPILNDCKIKVEASYLGIGIGSGSINTWISVDDFQFEIINSIPDVKLPIDFSIHPNPAENGTIKISGTSTLEEITIYDLIGNTVKSLKVNSTEKTVELNLTKGVYLVKTLNQTKRLVIK